MTAHEGNYGDEKSSLRAATTASAKPTRLTVQEEVLGAPCLD